MVRSRLAVRIGYDKLAIAGNRYLRRREWPCVDLKNRTQCRRRSRRSASTPFSEMVSGVPTRGVYIKC